MSLINENNCILVGIDYQEKLVNMLEKNSCVTKFQKLLTTAQILNLPVILTEQYPKGLGNTVSALNLENVQVIEKNSFSAMLQNEFKTAIQNSGKKQIIIGGIETHICVHQTVSDLINEGFEVFVVKDACASRNKYEFEQGISIMQQNGAKITCVEITLFELLKTSKHPKFKEIQALIK